MRYEKVYEITWTPEKIVSLSNRKWPIIRNSNIIVIVTEFGLSVLDLTHLHT